MRTTKNISNNSGVADEQRLALELDQLLERTAALQTRIDSSDTARLTTLQHDIHTLRETIHHATKDFEHIESTATQQLQAIAREIVK